MISRLADREDERFDERLDNISQYAHVDCTYNIDANPEKLRIPA